MTTYELGTTLRWKDDGGGRWRRGHVVRVLMPGDNGNPTDEPVYRVFDDRGGNRNLPHSAVEVARRRR